MRPSRSLLIVEAVLVLCGRVEWGSLITFLLMFSLGDAILRQEVFKMEFFYIPADSMVLFVIALVIGGIVAGLGWACIRKAESSHANDFWAGKYIASMLMTMVAAPLLSAILLGWACQQWFPDINDLTYCIILVLVIFALAKYVLVFFNEGLKDTWAMIKGDAKDVKEIANEAQVVIPKK